METFRTREVKRNFELKIQYLILCNYWMSLTKDNIQLMRDLLNLRKEQKMKLR